MFVFAQELFAQNPELFAIFAQHGKNHFGLEHDSRVQPLIDQFAAPVAIGNILFKMPGPGGAQYFNPWFRAEDPDCPISMVERQPRFQAAFVGNVLTAKAHDIRPLLIDVTSADVSQFVRDHIDAITARDPDTVAKLVALRLNGQKQANYISSALGKGGIVLMQGNDHLEGMTDTPCVAELLPGNVCVVNLYRDAQNMRNVAKIRVRTPRRPANYTVLMGPQMILDRDQNMICQYSDCMVAGVDMRVAPASPALAQVL